MLGKPKTSFGLFLCHMCEVFWLVVRLENLCLLQVQNSEIGGRSFTAREPKFWTEVLAGKLSLGVFCQDHLLQGSADLVVEGGLSPSLISLEVSHLDLNLLKEEFLTGFSPCRGFSLVECLELVSLVLVIFIHV